MKAELTLDNGHWDINDLGHYLKIKVKTLYAMVQEIPHYRIGKLIRFKKAEIDAWMEGKRAKSQDINAYPKVKRKKAEAANIDIDRLIQKTIDQSKHEGI